MRTSLCPVFEQSDSHNPFQVRPTIQSRRINVSKRPTDIHPDAKNRLYPYCVTIV